MVKETPKREEYDVMGEYVFTAAEKEEMASEMARKNIEAAALEDAKKAAMSDFKARIDLKAAELNTLATQYAHGKRYQIYKCWLDYDRTRKMRLWKAIDDDHVVKEEPMRPEDFQGKLPV